MNIFVVDTNILLHAVHTESDLHEKALALIEDWREGVHPWFVTWGILYEFLRVSTHTAVFKEPWPLTQSVNFIRELFESPTFGALVETERHVLVLEEMANEFRDISGNIVHDFHTAVLMRENGIFEIQTADTDFHRFPFLKVINPLR